jgi:2-keto-4-pentenoate hydratase/2-oxohepta-3-ene-1,7-dioic acid hydratase in catechol pathway
MRYCRVLVEGVSSHARIEGGRFVLLDEAPWAGGTPKGVTLQEGQLELLVPSAASKVVAVGQNYRKHAEELGKPIPVEPLLFLKPSTALNASGKAIVLPPDSQEVHHEAELGLVIGRTLRHASEREAQEGIFGLTCFNDVTARDIQRREVQHTRAKSYDTFACAGPWVETELSWAKLRVPARVNGELRQEGNTSDMIFSPPRLVAFISRVMTLLPGDIVATGTPSGVGPLHPGDRVEVEIEGIGTLVNPVLSGLS